jgi:hypothetical protein
VAPVVAGLAQYSTMIFRHWLIAIAAWMFGWFRIYEQIRNPNLFIVSTHNYSRDFTLNKLSVSAYEVTFANDLYIDIFTTLFYHLKHSRIVPLSIPVEFKQRVVAGLAQYSTMIFRNWLIAIAAWMFGWSRIYRNVTTEYQDK